MPKLYILDKDTTLTIPKSGNKFVQSPEDQKPIPGTLEFLSHLKADGSTIVLASNQGGVEAGHKTLQQAIAEMGYCIKLLPQITCAYFCPDFAGETCYRVLGLTFAELKGIDYRKPGGGMLKQAIEDWKNDRHEEVVMIGDRPEDEAAASAAGIRFAWIWHCNPDYPNPLRS